MKKTHLILTVLILTIFTTIAAAYTIPAPTDFAYDLYNVLVNKIFHGPIGFLLAVYLIAMGSYRCIVHFDYSSTSFSMTLYYVCWIFVGTIILKADSVMVSLGAVI